MKNTNNQIDKALHARGDLSEKEKLDLLASESLKEEKFMSDFMDMEYGKALNKFLKNNPDKTEADFIKLFRIPMESGGKVIDFAKYTKGKNPKIKEISLSSLFAPGKALSELTEAERNAVNNLLRMTFGRKD
tara:strand:- start:1154 stop:1549 length:396 start_codon:yes stop_codon:yes gene_type:complete